MAMHARAWVQTAVRPYSQALPNAADVWTIGNHTRLEKHLYRSSLSFCSCSLWLVVSWSSMAMRHAGLTNTVRSRHPLDDVKSSIPVLMLV